MFRGQAGNATCQEYALHEQTLIIIYGAYTLIKTVKSAQNVSVCNIYTCREAPNDGLMPARFSVFVGFNPPQAWGIRRLKVEFPAQIKKMEFCNKFCCFEIFVDIS